MEKNYTALGLMSGTSMDGVDASTIFSDGNTGIITSLKNQYFEYDKDLYEKLTNLRDKINNSKDLKSSSPLSKALTCISPLTRAFSITHLSERSSSAIQITDS